MNFNLKVYERCPLGQVCVVFVHVDFNISESDQCKRFMVNFWKGVFRKYCCFNLQIETEGNSERERENFEFGFKLNFIFKNYVGIVRCHIFPTLSTLFLYQFPQPGTTALAVR